MLSFLSSLGQERLERARSQRAVLHRKHLRFARIEMVSGHTSEPVWGNLEARDSSLSVTGWCGRHTEEHAGMFMKGCRYYETLAHLQRTWVIEFSQVGTRTRKEKRNGLIQVWNFNKMAMTKHGAG